MPSNGVERGQDIIFMNSYDCPCGRVWQDTWSCMCNDKCPSCGVECEPSKSRELDGPIKCQLSEPG